MTTYVNFATYKRGVKRSNGKGVRCMNCNRPATTAADKVNTTKRLRVTLCDEHAAVAKSLNEKGNR